MLKDLIIKNRSTRGYDRTRLVTDDELREMVDCARLSASSMAVQPIKFYITNDVAECDKITANVRYAGALPELGLPLEGTAPVAYIAICHDKRIHNNDKRFLKDCGIYAQTMSLAATEMGLNCLMIGAFDPDNIKQVLGLPDYYTVLLLLAVGKSIEHIELKDVDSIAAPEVTGTIEPGTDADIALNDYRKKDLAVVQYYRKDGIHYAPKRKLEDVIIKK